MRLPRNICNNADCTIGPRQIIAVSSSTRKPIGHDLETVILHRVNDAPIDLCRLTGNLQETRHRRAVDIGIQNADAQAIGEQAKRKIDGCGRLADAALAGGDSDDRANAGNADLAGAGRLLRRMRGMSMRLVQERGARRVHSGAAFLSAVSATKGALHARQSP